MGRSNKKYIWLIIILIVLIILTLGLMLYINQSDSFVETQTQDEVETSEEYIKDLEKVNNKKEYLNVKQCLDTFISTINQNSTIYYGYDENNNYTVIATEEVINTNIYSVLSQEYINKNGVTISNVRQFVYEIKKDCFYVPIDIYKKSEYGNIKTYAIYGVIEDMDYNPVSQSYLLLNIDKNNNTFSIEQLKSQEELNNIEIKNITSIENKINNVYEESGLLDENLITDYITTYKRLALAYPEIIYNNFLDDEYKIKKFNSLEKYKEYVNNNKENIKSINIEKYDISEQQGYTQYIAIDQNNKYYIFNVGDINDYKILLDAYTIDIPQFINKYNSASDVNKVGYNIQKFIDAINDEDYTYVYEKLDNTFKQNNFKTEEIFENYIKKNLYKNNIIEQNAEISSEGEVYIYNINVKNSKNQNEQKSMTVVMKLDKGTDFTMSFNIE